MSWIKTMEQVARHVHNAPGSFDKTRTARKDRPKVGMQWRCTCGAVMEVVNLHDYNDRTTYVETVISWEEIR